MFTDCTVAHFFCATLYSKYSTVSSLLQVDTYKGHMWKSVLKCGRLMYSCSSLWWCSGDTRQTSVLKPWLLTTLRADLSTEKLVMPRTYKGSLTMCHGMHPSLVEAKKSENRALMSWIFYLVLYLIPQLASIIIITRGQSNLTKSASRGAHSPVRGHPRGSKVVPLNSWGRVSY